MTDIVESDQKATEQGGETNGQRQAYRRPALVKLGSLRDVTLTLSAAAKYDGMSSRNTRRGGDFEAGSRR
mgnify:CR=1 FL=1